MRVKDIGAEKCHRCKKTILYSQVKKSIKDHPYPLCEKCDLLEEPKPF